MKKAIAHARIVIFCRRRRAADAGRGLADSFVEGAGTTPCAEVTRQYAQDAQKADDIYYSWAQGFLSGMNMVYLEINGNSLNLANSEIGGSKKDLLRSYCESHPDNIYGQAVLDLSNNLDSNPGVAPAHK